MASISNSAKAREYLAALEAAVSEKKVRHCVSVAELMLSFAPVIGLDDGSVLAAALLHDIARKDPPDELLMSARQYGIPVSPIEEARPKLLHGPVAAERCKRELGMTDPEVYEAIYRHTTACAGLCRLGQALYFADFAEPLRSYPEAARARDLLEKEGFEAALRYVAREKIGFLRDKDVVSPASEQFLAWLEKEQLRCRG